MATKEQIYTEQLRAMGIWEDAFAGAVHDLAVLEREMSRTRKAWKKSAEDGGAPSMLDEHYRLILQQGREISKLRESLGLTPRGLRRIKTARDEAFRISQQISEPKPEPQEEDALEAKATVLDFVLKKYGA